MEAPARHLCYCMYPRTWSGREIDLVVCSGRDLRKSLISVFLARASIQFSYHKGARDSWSHARIIKLDNAGGPEPHEPIVQKKRRVPLVPATLQRSTVSAYLVPA